MWTDRPLQVPSLPSSASKIGLQRAALENSDLSQAPKQAGGDPLPSTDGASTLDVGVGCTSRYSVQDEV